jgi:hypothetical protein
MGKLPYKSLREIPPFIRVFPRESNLQLLKQNGETFVGELF